MKKLTDEQHQELQEAFSHIVNLSIAREKSNHSTCCSFHIKPFKTHWDKKTVKELNYHIRLYIDTWVIPKMEQALGVKRSSIERYRRKEHKEAEIRYNKWINSKTK